MSTQAPQDRYIQVGDIHTRYWALGEGGSSVLLLHGIGASVEDWLPNVRVLAERYRVYAVDIVGFGRFDKPSTPYTVSYMAQFVKDFMDTLAIDQTHLIGHSMGGGIALQFVLKSPEKVRKLVLVAPAGLGRALYLPFRVCTLPRIGERLSRPSRKGTAQLIEDAVYDPVLVTDEWVELGYEMAALPGAQDAVLSALRSSCNLRGMRPDATAPIVENLASIGARTLIIWGKQDRILPVSQAYVAEEGIPDSRLHILDRCGHIPQLECAEAFNDLVMEFLD